MKHLVKWDTIELRVDGEKLNAMARTQVVAPIERLALRFGNGVLHIEGSVRKFVSIPFTVEVREIRAAGTTMKVPLRSAAAFGAIPIPQFLFRFAKDRLPKDLVRFEEPATFVVSLDRFLPPFVTVEIQKIWIIDGGLAVTLGRGGADPPPDRGDIHGAATERIPSPS